jgi:hypothetical protein
MSDLAFDDDVFGEPSAPEILAPVPEINADTYAKIDAWRDLIVTSRLVDRLPTYKAAATEIYLRALHETSMAAFKSIEDDIELLGSDYAELPIETVCDVMREALASATLQGGFVKNGPAGESISEEPPPDDRPPVQSQAEYGTGTAVAVIKPSPIVFVTPNEWPQEAPPPVDWLAAQRIPRGDVSTLHGDGGAGKTDIALQLAANLAREAPDWLAHDIAPGSVVFISAEDRSARFAAAFGFMRKRVATAPTR